jgi:hypothetical protein
MVNLCSKVIYQYSTISSIYSQILFTQMCFVNILVIVDIMISNNYIGAINHDKIILCLIYFSDL